MRPRFLAACLAAGLGCAMAAQAASSDRATARHGMVVTTQSIASRVGAEVLKRGGNAVDAAVAVGYALAVVHPAAGNIGGGGFMTIRFKDGTSRFLDFRERAPKAATPTMFQDGFGQVIPQLSESGFLAAAVPGTVQGFELALSRYGGMSRAELMAPAIGLAEKGFVLRPGDVRNIAEVAGELVKDEAAAAIFLRHGKPPKPGTRLRQPDLAQSLRLIAQGGADAFYRGPIAAEIVAASQSHHGILALDDFAGYAAHEREPVNCSYRGFDVTTAPPPSSGGPTLCEILNILEGYDLASMGFHSPAELHVLAEAMRRAFFDRAAALGDPDFVENPVGRMLDKDYAASMRGKIERRRATPSRSLGTVEVSFEGNHTTDYMIIDGDGTAVAVVYTLNDWFGAKVVAGKTGIVLNNEMDDFTAKPGVPNEDGLVSGSSNEIRPGKAPLSSMAPTILSQNGQTRLLIGSYGSGTIITSIAQAIVNLVDYRMTLTRAVNAPRIHQQWLPDHIAYDDGAFPAETARQLHQMGYDLNQGTHSGASEAILVGGDRLSDHKPVYVGVNDHRAPVGAAIGW
jgi:gamma-glutamyltranspeptidase/glutathione hydrolase